MDEYTSNAKERIYTVVAMIPRGYVLTYGDVARLARVRSPRYVGYCLHHNPDPDQIHCHRVVNSSGETAPTFAFGGDQVQKQLLEAEGVVFKGKKIVLSRFRWQPSYKAVQILTTMFIKPLPGVENVK
jgi:methylated-DNA-protein-cysteine methyltransferase-like protein